VLIYIDLTLIKNLNYYLKSFVSKNNSKKNKVMSFLLGEDKMESQTQNNFQADLVVLGAGGAGLTAAIAAAEKGAKVLVVEKKSPGGNSALAGGFFASESKIQKRMMIDARRADLFKIAMDYSHWQIDPELIRTIINKSADTVQWLEDRGVEFELVFPLYPNQNPLTWHLVGGGGASLVKALVNRCERLGVQLLRNTKGKRLIMDPSGKIKGTLIKLRNEEITIMARSIVIATGGYGGNKELLKKYFPYYTNDMCHLGVPACTGEGLGMAMEAGAATEGLGTLQLHGPYFPGNHHIDSLSRQPNTCWVNLNGKRYLDETLTFTWPECGNALARQPGARSFTLLDAKMLSKIIENGTRTGQIHVPPGTRLVGVEKKLEQQADRGNVKISDSWDQIAVWAGVDSQVLNNTIDTYNSFCDRGVDDLFSKDQCYLEPLRRPPYYAIRCHASFLGTIGGIKINAKMEVIDQNDSPIKGLYAAGQDTGGWECDTYNPLLAGMTFGFALNSGRIAGENAADYVL
jgi:fumarate reductase flavoprotein subunit